MVEQERPLVEVADLTKDFDVSPPWLNRVLEGKGRVRLRAVDAVSFAIPHGRTFSLVGESGCGKSTVAKLVVGLLRPTSGAVRLVSRASGSARRGARVQMIFQDPYASLNPRWRVYDIVAEPLRTLKLTEERSAERRRVDELLGLVGLAAADGSKYPHEFSGGQRQRISIARALASEPEFLVCDEPTSALDVSVQAQVLNLMKELQDELGLTYLFISHNLAVVRHVSDEVAVMYLGRIVEQAAVETLYTSPRHPYTRLLLDTIPELERPNRDRQPLGGEVPSPLDPPPGCSFNPRCALADGRCRAERPALRSLPDAAHAACHAVDEGRLPDYRRATA
jgi:peptide/nickel transport system ATP-binding protein